MSIKDEIDTYIQRHRGATGLFPEELPVTARERVDFFSELQKTSSMMNVSPHLRNPLGRTYRGAVLIETPDAKAVRASLNPA